MQDEVREEDGRSEASLAVLKYTSQWGLLFLTQPGTQVSSGEWASNPYSKHIQKRCYVSIYTNAIDGQMIHCNTIIC